MISTCLIAINEEKNLKNLYEDLKIFSDEIILVDTGSTDNTKKVAEELGMKVYDFEWNNNFADARNFSFSKATGDWIFWCDLDDRIIGGENVKKLEKVADKKGVDWFVFEYLYAKDEFGNTVATHWKPRLVRNKGLRWEKSVHENLVGDNGYRAVKETSVVIDHQKNFADAEKAAVRNLNILINEYNQEKENTDPRTLYYLGMSLAALQRFEEGIPFFRKHIEKCGWDEEKYFSLCWLSYALRKVKRYDEGVNAGLEATKVHPDWPLAYFRIAESYADRSEFARAVEWFQLGFTKKRPEVISVTNDLDYDYHPLGQYIYCLLNLNRWQEATKSVDYLMKKYQAMPKIQQLYSAYKEISELETFVKSFELVVDQVFKKQGNVKKLFEALPNKYDEDRRIIKLKNTLTEAEVWPTKSIVFYCYNSYEDWADPSVMTGIGGSESAVIYLSREFAKRGYKVVVYNRCGDLRGVYNGVEYRPYYFLNLRDKFDIFVAWRNPNIFSQKLDARVKLCWLHDRPIEPFNDVAVKATDKFIVLSDYHKSVLSLPEDKVFVSANGLDSTEITDFKKNPHSLIYASSYDRGLEHLLKIWPEVKKAVPSATLDIYYGWDTFNKMYGPDSEQFNWKTQMESMMKQKGITEHGRVNKRELAKSFAKSSIWAYPTDFWEISCITAMMAQANGAVPATTDFAALNETVKYGIKEAGITEINVMPEGVLKKYTKDLIALLKNVRKQQEIRPEMMKWAREQFTWSRVADGWSKLWS